MKPSLFLLFISSCAVFCFGQSPGPAPIKCNRPNEEESCVSACPPERTCTNRGIQFNCLHGGKICQIKCVCKKGYFRNSVGECITDEQCDTCTRPNEHYACGSACQTECSTLGTPCPIVNVRCNDSCYCVDGYARNSTGNCVPYAECDVSPNRSKRGIDGRRCFGLNEEYVACKKDCPPDTCLSLVAKFKCDANAPCKPGCKCKPGYLRENPDTACMPLNRCSQLRP